MSLPAGQQCVLNRIDARLQASDPQLAAMYAIFTRLSAGEPVTREQVRTGPLHWVRSGSVIYAIVLIPVMFAAIITGALMGGSGRGAATCKAGYQAVATGPDSTGNSGPAVSSRYVSLTGGDQQLSPPARARPVTAGAPAGVC